MAATRATPPGAGGYFSLFNLPGTPFRTDVLQALGSAMTNATIHGPGSMESGYVYFGQLIAHDVTHLRKPATGFLPATMLEQLRTPELDLDGVYGLGDSCAVPVVAATGKLELGCVTIDGRTRGAEDDLPRTLTGTARIGDERNDENLLLAQLHVQFLKLHNYFVDQLNGDARFSAQSAFEQARRELILHYQQVVLYDYLEKILDPIVWDYLIVNGRRSFWEPVAGELPRVPIEFAAAGFRFGHSMVRNSYALNRSLSVGIETLFRMTGRAGLGSLTGPLPQSHVVDWRRFFKASLPHAGDPATNLAFPIDPDIAIVLPRGPSLATTNLEIGNLSALPHAQALVEHLALEHRYLSGVINLAPLSRDELNPDVFVQAARQTMPLLSQIEQRHGLDRKTPLWYYLLVEAHTQHGGRRLGTLGSLIVGTVLRSLVRLSSPSVSGETFVSRYIEPTKQVPASPAVPTGMALCMDDLLRVLRTQ